MARVGSINHQVGNIIKAHNGIRQSKLESRNESGLISIESGHKVSDKFHSYKSLDNARNDLKSLGNYAKEKFAIKDMSQINKTVVDNWIRSKDILKTTEIKTHLQKSQQRLPSPAKSRPIFLALVLSEVYFE